MVLWIMSRPAPHNAPGIRTPLELAPVPKLFFASIRMLYVAVAILVGCCISTADENRVSFVNEIQPIFARSCTSCHGGVKQAGDISFVSSDTILPPDGWVVEPGDPEESSLYQRIISEDPEERMPPPHEHPAPLSQQETELIRRWIAEGADWQEHWARAPLAASPIPHAEAAKDWSRRSIDAYVFDRLARAGLKPSQEAPPEQWLRRVSFDLIGLPPTPEQTSAFMADVLTAKDDVGRERLYASVVHRLLASPRFGERWAAMWMDLARYADSKGFEKDPHRDIWPYRDWLIDAFNSDMPYDEFTIKQLAGDLLPDAKLSDILATAFHRNTQTNTEGGTDDEEYRVAAVIDRLNTTWTTWQATTFGCVQCHSHPYEPYDNDEFYAGLAIFNNTEDADLGTETPTIPYLSDPRQQDEYLETQRAWIEARDTVDQLGHDAANESAWEMLNIGEASSTTGQIGVIDDEVRVVAGTVAVGSTYTLDTRPDEKHSKEITAFRFTIRPDSDDPADWPEQGSVLSFLKMQVVPAEDNANSVTRDVTLEYVIPDFRSGVDGLEQADCDEMLHSNNKGFGGYPKLFGPRRVIVAPQSPITLAAGETLTMAIKQDASVTGGLSNHLRRFQVEFTQSDAITKLLARDQYKHLRSQVAELKKKWRSYKGIRVPVMQDRTAAAQRSTRKFIRGNWLERGEEVQPRIPDIFQPRDSNKRIEATNRLEFAQWLVSPQNPMASRVWVNRVWAELFGTGIVETLEDFGASGQPPSHPKLLDHLAITMQSEHRWSLKTLLESIVLSATYRQDARATEELRERDPRNRLLARGPRTRLTAEMVRDQALLASGVLVNRIGGPSVMPPQPDGVWQQVYSANQWKVATNEDRFRRGVYTYWKRTSPYPGFVMFDTPSRDVCSPRRIATNTPLQALVTLNSEVYTELAGKLAERSSKDNKPLALIIGEMFYRVVSRPPSNDDLAELMSLHSFLKSESDSQQKKGTQANQVLPPLGVVALAILNSDWAITK